MSDMQHDLDRPTYHLAGRKGWINDPNAVLMHEGRLHLFFQSLPNSSVWTFGIVWGHVVSEDLVTWWHMPDALEPTPGHLDADGCFSGCGLVDADGMPTILYTGVRLRSNPSVGPLPSPEDDLGLPFIESQLCAAQADAGDPLLTTWTKLKGVALPAPPEELRPASKLMGWRDPYIFDRPNEANGMTYGMLLGNGIRDVGGCVLHYRSKSLVNGWRYAGMLCSAEHTRHGAMYECPVLVQPPRLADTTRRAAAGPGAAAAAAGELIGACDDGGVGGVGVSGDAPGACTHVLFISPDAPGACTHVLFISPDAPVNPVLYWVGCYADGKFDLQNAKGPFRLDQGASILYAVNTFSHPDGRLLLWGWLQEQPEMRSSLSNSDVDGSANGSSDGAAEYDFAGCLTIPRELYLSNDGRLVQRPLRELTGLHVPGSGLDIAQQTPLPSDKVLLLPANLGPAVHLHATFSRGDASQVGFIIQAEKLAGTCGTAILYSWTEDQLLLTHDHAFDPATGVIRDTRTGNVSSPSSGAAQAPPTPQLGPVHKHVHGSVGLPQGSTLELEVFIDGSAVEVFVTNVGVAMSTRIYRSGGRKGGARAAEAKQQETRTPSSSELDVQAAAAAGLGAASISSQGSIMSAREADHAPERSSAGQHSAGSSGHGQQQGVQLPWLALMAVGGEAAVSQVKVREMASCWRDQPQALKPSAAAPEPAAPATPKHFQRARPRACMAPDVADTYMPANLGRCGPCQGLHRHGECPLLREHDHAMEPLSCSVPLLPPEMAINT